MQWLRAMETGLSWARVNVELNLVRKPLWGLIVHFILKAVAYDLHLGKTWD